MDNGNFILRTKDLDAGYAGNVVLKKASLTLEKGQILAIIGQNGTGKSTLLKTLSGLLPKISGDIWLRNNKMNTIIPYKMVSQGISYFTQGGLIMPELTVLEHLKLAAFKADKIKNKEAFGIVFDCFPKLFTYQQHKAGNLSGGERQILSLGILVMQGSNLWMMDEPTAGLSPDMVEFTVEFLRKRNQENGLTLLLVEHNVDVVSRLATHLVATKKGTITQKYEKVQFKEKNKLNEFVYN